MLLIEKYIHYYLAVVDASAFPFTTAVIVIPPPPYPLMPCICYSRCSCQTPNPVLELEYLRPVNSNGRKLDRSVILHFLSMGEFVDAVLQDDFELGVRVNPVTVDRLCRRTGNGLLPHAA